jgi:hypothetical protein
MVVFMEKEDDDADGDGVAVLYEGTDLHSITASALPPSN